MSIQASTSSQEELRCCTVGTHSATWMHSLDSHLVVSWPLAFNCVPRCDTDLVPHFVTYVYACAALEQPGKGNIMELEATYTSGSKIDYKEGVSFHVTSYPRFLFRWFTIDEQFTITETEEEEDDDDLDRAAEHRLAKLERDTKEMKGDIKEIKELLQSLVRDKR